jgi:hypothetical protein
MAKKRKNAKKKTGEAPTFSCILLCEDVTVSYGSDKHNLYGIVSEMFSPFLPFQTGRAVAYVRLSNFYANQRILIRFAHVETGDVIFEIPAIASKDSNPLTNHIIIAPVFPFVISRSGRYIFSALHDDIAIAECVITVKTLQDGQEITQ